MSVPEIQKPIETQEAPPESEITAAELGKEAEEKAKKNEGLREMAKLKAELPPEQQRAGFEVLKGYLISIIALLKAKNIPISTLKQKPELLPYLVRANNFQPDQNAESLPRIEIDEEQRNALYNFERLMAGQGETKNALKDPNLWAEMSGEAIKISKDPMEQWKEWHEASPILTEMVTTGAVVLGVGLLYKGLKALLDSKDKAEKTPEQEKFWTKKKIGVAALFATVIFGRNHLVDFGKWMVKDEKSKDVLVSSTPQITKHKEVNSERLDNPDGSNILCIGDSMCHGFQIGPKWSKRPDFIGEDGMRTSRSLELLKKPESRKKIRGKKIILYTGGNSVGGNGEKCSPQGIVKDMIEMAKICDEEGAAEVTICTRFPIDPRRQELPLNEEDSMRLGPDGYAKRIIENKALYDELNRAFLAKEFPAKTRLVDLFAQFDNGKGEMRPEFPGKENDYRHPYSAFTAALNLILSDESKDKAKPPALT